MFKTFWQLVSLALKLWIITDGVPLHVNFTQVCGYHVSYWVPKTNIYQSSMSIAHCLWHVNRNIPRKRAAVDTYQPNVFIRRRSVNHQSPTKQTWIVQTKPNKKFIDFVFLYLFKVDTWLNIWNKQPYLLCIIDCSRYLSVIDCTLFNKLHPPQSVNIFMAYQV